VARIHSPGRLQVGGALFRACPRWRQKVIGGGITAAIIADRLVAEGLDVAVVEQCEIGWGSTAASTALLQYEIDTPMTELARRYGEPRAVLVYLSCAQAIHRLQALAADVGGCEFRRQESLYLASRRWHVPRLREEFDLRRAHGLDVVWLPPSEIAARYRFEAAGAILSREREGCCPAWPSNPRSRGQARSPRRRTVCRSSGRIPSTARACTSRWPTAEMASLSPCRVRMSSLPRYGAGCIHCAPCSLSNDCGERQPGFDLDERNS
jgi:hypothetical protein